MQQFTSFTSDTFAAFRADDRPGPVQMLNLIRLQDQASYDSGEICTGRTAYYRYSMISAPVLAGLGGRIVWRGRWKLGLIGPVDERWDICFIAEYPSVQSFADMFRNPVYRDAMQHRQAAVLDSRLICLTPAEAGGSFLPAMDR